MTNYQSKTIHVGSFYKIIIYLQLKINIIISVNSAFLPPQSQLNILDTHKSQPNKLYFMVTTPTGPECPRAPTPQITIYVDCNAL